MFQRLCEPSRAQSFFLFGARGTGKSTLIRNYFKNKSVYFIDLLSPEIEQKFLTQPELLKSEILENVRKGGWVVIDEIQKLPKLLDVVHQLIESHKIHFALTGSSSRKLKRGGANLLAGRAFVFELFPLTAPELALQFDLESVLQWGALPRIFSLKTIKDKVLFLKSYSMTYLKEEIKAEQIVRNLSSFARFLEVAAQMNTKILNYTKIADDVGVDTKTVQTYFEILVDTHVGYLLDPFHRSIRKRQRTNPKFYFFDCGVVRSLSQRLNHSLDVSTMEFGELFEQFIFNEMLRLNSYKGLDFRFSYLRTKDDAEIDFIIERPGLPIALVEVKSSSQIRENHAAALNKFSKDFKSCDCFILSRDPVAKRFGSTRALPWKKGLEEIGFY